MFLSLYLQQVQEHKPEFHKKQSYRLKSFIEITTLQEETIMTSEHEAKTLTLLVVAPRQFLLSTV